MTTGILGRATLSSGVDTVIYTVPIGKQTVCTINLCNPKNKSCSFRIALSAGNVPSAGDWIEYDCSLAANSAMNRAGIVLNAGTRIIIRSDNNETNIVVWGYEEGI